MREKYYQRRTNCEAEYEESKVKSFSSSVSTVNSFRIYDKGTARIHYAEGTVSDEAGFTAAEDKACRPYDFEPTAEKQSRNLTESPLSDRELLKEAEELIELLRSRYPDFIFSGGISKDNIEVAWTNEAGMDLSYSDCSVYTGIGFKHKDSKDIHDGWFGCQKRTYSRDSILTMAEDYLGQYGTMCRMPEEVIILTKGMFSSLLISSLNGEGLALGVSLLSDKIGETVFSPDVILMNNLSAENAYMTPFWDGEGYVLPEDKKIFIDKGKILYGISDRKTARKYGVPHTFGAGHSYGDLPTPGRIITDFVSSGKTAKELLDGRCAVIPLMYSGGGFNEKGDYAMPVQNSLLWDGEKILGRLPAFAISGNMFDFFGKDFIGIPSDKPVLQERNCQLIRVKAQPME